MIKTLPLYLALIGLAALPQTAVAQDPAPYQPLEIRQLCTAQSLRDTPAGTELLQLAAGAQVRLRDVTYGPDEQVWLQVSHTSDQAGADATGYVPASAARHFCPQRPLTSKVDTGALQSYVAPLNTCHLTAGRADSLAALNAMAARLPDFAPTLSAYRLRSGEFALTLGLVSTGAAQTMLRRADHLPTGSSCTTGSDFAEALVYDGKRFAAPGFSAYPDAASQLKAAQDLLTPTFESKDPGPMKQACDLGLGAACSYFAGQIYSDDAGPDRGPAVVTRYAMLGCLSGDASGCQFAVNRVDNTLELAREQAMAGQGLPEETATAEIAKALCDVQDRFGCVIQARFTAPSRAPRAAEARSNFLAYLTACQQGIGWVCEELPERFADVVDAREDRSTTPDEKFALAGMGMQHCTPGSREPNTRLCTSAYYLYRDFLKYRRLPAPGPAQVATAVAALTKGCAAGDPAACATLAALPDHFSEADRRAATARALALCDAQTSKDSICDSLGAALDPTLAEARPALQRSYDRLAQSCLTPAKDAGNDCFQAMSTYAKLGAPDGMDKAEAMLNRACSPENVNGCRALTTLYGDRAEQNLGITLPRRDNSAALLRVLRMGCRAEEGVSLTCAELADELIGQGDITAAQDIRADICTRMIAGDTRQDAWGCYDGVKTAIAEGKRLPEALHWADAICTGDDVSIAPYACKLKGNILSAGKDVPVDRDAAFAAYQNGCFHPRVSTTDGQSCLIYGDLLREAVRLGETPVPPLFFAHREEGEEPTPTLLLSEASRAYDMGCMDDIAPACAANETLLQDWTVRDLPANAYVCQVRTAAGQVSSEKPCRQFIFYQAQGDQKQKREQIGLNVYVWPDGQRSVTYIQDTVWRLNEVKTDYPSKDGTTLCWHNPVTTRSFCVTPAG